MLISLIALLGTSQAFVPIAPEQEGVDVPSNVSFVLSVRELDEVWLEPAGATGERIEVTWSHLDNEPQVAELGIETLWIEAVPVAPVPAGDWLLVGRAGGEDYETLAWTSTGIADDTAPVAPVVEFVLWQDVQGIYLLLDAPLDDALWEITAELPWEEPATSLARAGKLGQDRNIYTGLFTPTSDEIELTVRARDLAGNWSEPTTWSGTPAPFTEDEGNDTILPDPEPVVVDGGCSSTGGGGGGVSWMLLLPAVAGIRRRRGRWT